MGTVRLGLRETRRRRQNLLRIEVAILIVGHREEDRSARVS